MFNITIGKKLGISSGIAGLLVGIMLFGEYIANTNTGHLTEALVREQTILESIAGANVALSRMETGYKTIDFARSPAEAAKAVADSKAEAVKAARELERPIAIALKPDVLKAAQHDLTRLAAMIEDFARVGRADLRNQAVDAAAVGAIRQSIQALLADAGKQTDEALTNARRFTNEASTEVGEHLTLATRVGVTAHSVTIVILFASALYLMMNITHPLRSLVRSLDRMAQGDFGVDIAEAARGDEIGTVGRSVEAIKVQAQRKAAEEAEARLTADAVAARDRQSAMQDMADRFEAAVGSIIGQVSASAAELQATAEVMTLTATRTAGPRPWPPPPRRRAPTSPWSPRRPRSWGAPWPRSAARSAGRPTSPSAPWPRRPRPRTSCTS
ncbi:hypothetical protein OCOJLMKI_2855 [Methylobacterium iners]|uniref:HAMP domain-containing protein n=1 Tax=Methylobacterium iners TaxID=418707 RepID=A0ABQ4S0D2_9HYPH|nr:hypothetical protein OCOJLMKI_2855 [Methylobacterium iners]